MDDVDAGAGLRGDEVSGQHILNLDIGLPVQKLRAVLKSCLSGENSHQHLVLEAVNRRGRKILCQVTCSPLLGADASVPLWVVLSCHAAMGLGTLMGGWRIVKTMGQRICHLQPVHGFAAESGGALCLYGATWLGIPVSTTHTITGAIVGVGATRGRKAVRWGVAGRVVWAWVLTIPAAAIVAAGTWHVFALLGWR